VLAGVRLSETAHPAGQRLADHAHAAASLCLVLAGGFRERAGARDAIAAPSTLIARAPGVEHGDTFGAAASRCFNVEIEVDAATGPALDVDGGPRAWAAARLLVELRDGADDLVLDGLAHELAARCFTPDEPAPAVLTARDAVRGTVEELRDRLAERVALHELADGAGVHAMHLTRLFRRAHGTSIGEYVRGLRIELACQMLAASPAPVAAIALRVGFTDQAHLTRVFRRLTGTTPARYRALLAA
jgi:AraC family transcriptional regulator